MKNQPIFDELVRVIRDQAQQGEFPAYLTDMVITPDTTLDQLGLDSLCKMSLLEALMDITDRYFPDEYFVGARTLGEIVNITNSTV